MNTKFIVASFLPIYPVTFGSSVVISSFFESIPSKNKTLFQISAQKRIKNRNIVSTIPLLNNYILKFIAVIFLIKKVLIKIYSSKLKNILIIEGASWIGYTFILVLLVKILFPKVKIIYRGHSIEYEIRKNNSNFIITNLSFLFEKYVYKNVDCATSVSSIEKNKIKKLYNVKTYVYPNIILFKKFKKKLNFKYKYIFYSGSYEYLPNKIVIDRLVKKIMPSLLSYYPNLKLVITGGKKLPYNYKWIKTFGLVSKSKYISLLKNSVCLAIPSNEGYGTRVKIIEALCYGAIVVSSKIGIEGIEFNKKIIPPFNCDTDKNFIRVISSIIKDKKFKKIAQKNTSKFIEYYSAKFQNKKFLKEIL